MRDACDYVWEAYMRAPYEAVVAAYVYAYTTAAAVLGTGWQSVLYVWSFFTFGNIFFVVRLAASLGMLYALRHPSILPDEEVTTVGVEAQARPRIESTSPPVSISLLDPGLKAHPPPVSISLPT